MPYLGSVTGWAPLCEFLDGCHSACLILPICQYALALLDSTEHDLDFCFQLSHILDLLRDARPVALA